MVWCQLLTSKKRHLRSEERGFLARPQLLRKLWSMPTLKDGDETHESNYDGNQHFARASCKASSWIHDQRPNRLITNVATIIDYQYANAAGYIVVLRPKFIKPVINQIEPKLLHFKHCFQRYVRDIFNFLSFIDDQYARLWVSHFDTLFVMGHFIGLFCASL